MKKNIIIADNDEVIAYLTSCVVKDLGNNALWCSRALDVIEKVRSHPHFFNLVISNQTINDLSALQLAEELYKINPDIAVIVLTSNNKNPESYYKYSNIKDIIVKPVSKEILHKSIKNIFGE